MSCVLRSDEDVLGWLSRPENQFSSDVYILRWDGCAPRIGRSRLVYLQSDPGFRQFILEEHLRRRLSKVLDHDRQLENEIVPDVGREED